MTKYILKRLLISLITIFVLCTVTFFVIRWIPGDPFENPKITEEMHAQLVTYYGLDKPVIVQYGGFLKNLFNGHLGYSIQYTNRPVTEIIGEAFPYSFDLGVRALLFATIAGISLGITAALNRKKTLDYVSILVAVIGISVPSFVVASSLQYFFGVKLGVLPVSRYESFASTILPSFALGLGTLATLTRLMRTSMLEVISTDYVKTAKSKGVGKLGVILKHQLRNALLPIVTILGPTAAFLMTGTFIVEQIFAIPGLGRHFIMAVQNTDYSLVTGLTIFFGSVLVLMNFLVDLVYGLIDPRIRG
ncbi:ABC transporter permease [Mycoplasmatota bacterium]|nr:ABC transporter permease [Mycoplasmatota bacterium]